jgi:hypothetical protein
MEVGDFKIQRHIRLAPIQQLLFGNGNNIFQDQMNGSIVESPRCLIVSDFNNDVKLDLATAYDFW